MYGGFSTANAQYLLIALQDLATSNLTLTLMQRDRHLDVPSLVSLRYEVPTREIAFVSFINMFSSDFVVLDTKCIRIYQARKPRLVVNATDYFRDDDESVK